MTALTSNLTETTLRTMMRAAWSIIDLARGLARAGERLEAWTEGLAARRGHRMEAVLWPLIEAHRGARTGR